MKLRKFLEFKESDLDPVKSFKIQDDLNSKIWDNFELDREVREDLLQIGEDFYDSTDLEADVIDIVLCGSLCNYNWSEKYSDYDLHIIINYKDIDENMELVEKLCDLSKKMWNTQHEIEIKGYPVEVAIQDEKDLKKSIKGGRMGGVFSLMKNKWVKKPEKVDFEPDEKLIAEKGKTIMLEVDDIIEQSKKLDYDEIKERVKKVWDKIKKLRERALEEEGEFGIGNLVFKLLRRSNYMGKIMDLKKNAYDKQFEGKVLEHTEKAIFNFLFGLELIIEELNRTSDESWSTNLNYEYDEDMCQIKIEMGGCGYSDGWSEDWLVDFGDAEWVVVTDTFRSSGPYGDTEGNNQMKFDTLGEVLQEIKEIFGL